MREVQIGPESPPEASQKFRDYNSIEQQLLMQYNIARILAESSSISNAAAQVLQMICETAGWEFGALWKVEPETNTLTNEGVWHAPNANLSEYAVALRYSFLSGNESSLPGHVLPDRKPLWISKIDRYESMDALDAVRAGLLSAFILPIHSGKKVIAVLECLSTRNQYQDRKIADMLQAVGNQIGVFVERKQFEEELIIRGNQQQLLAQAGLALSSSIDYEKRLLNLAHVVVPAIADWCAIDVIDQNNLVRRVAAVHIDPAKEKIVYDLQPTRVVKIDQKADPEVESFLTGHSLLIAEVTPSLIEKTIRDPDQVEMYRKLDPKSFIVVPLIGHERILGICMFVQSDSRRQYLPGDLELAEDIGRRVAVALENAMLYDESKRNNIMLAQRVEERTAQLSEAVNLLTKQVIERQQAEEQYRKLNSELEQRIAERTSQLEVSNRKLQKEVLGHQQVSQTLRTLLKRTRELYRISQMIGTVREPNEVLSVLLSSSFLKDASRASIAILNKPWREDDTPPESGYILAEWNKRAQQPRYLNHDFTLQEFGIVPPVQHGQPIVIQDIQSITALSETIRKRFASLRTMSLIILPLIAGGEWYGLLSLHFRTRRITSLDDLRHVRGLVNETAIAIKNIHLLEIESQARQEAEAANELKLKFLAMISHELRTPLASIKGFVTTLLAEDVVWPVDKQLDFLQTIDAESDKLDDLIEQLLDLSRLEAGILRVSPKKLPFNSIITTALPQMQSLTTKHELVLDIPRRLPDVYADVQRIAQVLINLVGNAAKYSPQNTLITISAHKTSDGLQIDVADQGGGIPPHERHRIFNPFYQMKNGSGVSRNGAGLGLAICKGLVEAHGGKIWIQDRLGPGTVVSFTLPFEQWTKDADPKDR